jgi:hypothetical protein
MAGPVTNLGDMNVMRRNLGWRHTLLYVAVVVTVTFLWGWIIYANLEWSDVWSHTREYYATNLSVAGFDGEIAGALANPSGWGMPREVHYAAVLLLLLLTLNGAWLAMKEFWVNPCLHCAHFQQDLRLNPAICRQPCWKSRLIRSIKGRNPTWRSVGPPIADVEGSRAKTP